MAQNHNDTPERPQRWQRRERRRRSERERIKKHGARTASLYAAALRKRLRDKSNKH
ncbi:MAG TPA: hypothetical protein VFY10_10545 [Dehalococcoidia bacterium]|jgi:hypothetical protein|nr:hypothetical protein [Dehalococcoidia bacterium]